MNARDAIAELRRQLTELVTEMGMYAPPVRPSRYNRFPDADDKNGPIWDVPHHGSRPKRAQVAVRVLDHDDAACVYVEGGDFSFYGDMSAYTTAEGRAFAMALLAACDWADNVDPLSRKRNQRDMTGDPR